MDVTTPKANMVKELHKQIVIEHKAEATLTQNKPPLYATRAIVYTSTMNQHKLSMWM